MTLRTLTALAGAALFLSVGTANADPKPVAPTAAHNLDFGKLPNGWKASRNPNGEPRGVTNIVDNEAALARIVVEAADTNGKSIKDLAKDFVAQLKDAGHRAIGPVKDKNGDWSIEVVIVEDGVAAGKGFCIIRTFKSDPGAAYLFQGMWPNASDSLPAVKEARAIAKSAKLK